MEIYLVRHGQTKMNTEHCLQGRTDTVLNETGIQQAKAMHDFITEKGIHFDAVLVSPLKRVKQTAELLTGMDHRTFIEEPRLIEMSFGDYEGHKLANLPEKFYHGFFEDPSVYEAPKGAESYDDALQRVDALLTDLKGGKLHERYKDKTILLASHGALSHCITTYLDQSPRKDMWKITIDNCALLKLDLENSTYEFVHPGFSRPRYNPNK
ncbi:alpha-ribazole phosphatase [Lachnospiraceae bacterium A10]|jgi:broad specificity phosphatase PhoE|nr:alpha-ribazole phosphatase [Lachnospiraceae bacterium A10]